MKDLDTEKYFHLVSIPLLAAWQGLGTALTSGRPRGALPGSGTAGQGMGRSGGAAAPGLSRWRSAGGQHRPAQRGRGVLEQGPLLQGRGAPLIPWVF